METSDDDEIEDATDAIDEEGIGAVDDGALEDATDEVVWDITDADFSMEVDADMVVGEEDGVRMIIDENGRTDRRTDRPTDTRSYRDARTHLKSVSIT